MTTGVQLLQGTPTSASQSEKGAPAGSLSGKAQPATAPHPRLAAHHASGAPARTRTTSVQSGGLQAPANAVTGALGDGCCVLSRAARQLLSAQGVQSRIVSIGGAPATATGRPRGRAGPSGAWCRAARTAAASARRPAAAAAPTWGPGHCRTGTPCQPRRWSIL